MSTSHARIRVPLGERSYDVVVGGALIDDPASFAAVAGGGKAIVVTNEVVSPLLGARARHTLEQVFSSVSMLVLADGESSKRWETLNAIFDELLRTGCDRQTTLVALGGGVIGDLTGFAAACYMRGIDFVQIPTTLLAQVDSSVGGKTGINHPLGKNMIGAFHQPRLVVADVSVLATLPRRELVAGLAEVIKYGAICDPAFLGWIEAHLAELLAVDADALVHAVRRSCEIKAEIVAGDEREAGRRAVLNFGHTFGHAFETGLGYGVMLHGEAVGCGMVLAARLSARLGLIDAARARRLEALLARAGLGRIPAFDADPLVALMRHDKKALGGELRFVLLEGESGCTVRPVPEADVLRLLREPSSAD